MKEGVQIIKKKSRTNDAVGSFQSAGSSTGDQKVSVMVGLDDVLYEMLDKITGRGRARQIIPILGIGSLGKTTLARTIYANPLVKEHFDICAWSTISQLHSARKILTEILGQVGLDNGGDLSDYEIGEQLYKYLIGRRYLIVMDDVWSIEAWDRVRSFFPDNGNGSRVIVTTRLSNLASKFDYSNGLYMKFLDEATSWNLFSKTVFGYEICPIELEDIGKKIVKGCRGLPLSIVVIGGLLSKSEPTVENWEVIEENLSSVVNMEEDGSCLQTLYMSYNNLPIHLKPRFLYMGVFPEDDDIQLNLLIQLWVAEGFVKPIEGKSLEEAAEVYLEELVDRNLVLVEERNLDGRLKSFKVHDLLMDLALREAKRDRFLCVLMQRSCDDREISHVLLRRTQRRITSLFKEEYPLDEVLESVAASSLVRTFIGRFAAGSLSLHSLRLLRVCIIEEESHEEILIRLLNLRLAFVDAAKTPSSITFLWNLQILYLYNIGFDQDYILDIWKMPLLRQVITSKGTAFRLPDPPPSPSSLGGKEVVLENLHKLSTVSNLKLIKEVLKRIPNIRILKLEYESESESESEKCDKYCVNTLHRLDKLQDLHLIRYGRYSRLMEELSLPCSLKQLTLWNTQLPWEEMESKIGCLPLLQRLQLENDAFIGCRWETVEGQFSSLKYLGIFLCPLEHWITDYTHFPCLEHLVLYRLKWLGEIPSGIGDIPTLQSLELERCQDSVVESAQRIVEEQQEMGNQDIQLQLK